MPGFSVLCSRAGRRIWRRTNWWFWKLLASFLVLAPFLMWRFTRTLHFLVWRTGPKRTLTCTITIRGCRLSLNTENTRFLTPNSTFCRSGPVGWSFGRCRYHHHCERCDGDQHASTIPFGPPTTLSSALGQKGLLSAEDCLSTAFQQILIVNSVIPCVLHFSGMVLFLFLFLFFFMMILFPLHNILWVKFLIPFIPPYSLNFSSFSGALWQDLIPPSGVTSVDAEKLRQELSSHPDQTRVNYVVSGIQWLSVGFNPQPVL